ncbi:S1C family serine protease [Anaerotalea alkaliphila]|uniref:PDZ domain-containing protein n=1 Tax=Anaerotalea alkaliphila TaxID=2662126 RepID=A0A7X5HXA8_9FIRM|nr:trypsin-like peptidase domain-containing protein [Anaerotalea alkaliphila]NDL68201.1 PDZ domain-containing protein [Anaerotalea alkaliphila]
MYNDPIEPERTTDGIADEPRDDSVVHTTTDGEWRTLPEAPPPAAPEPARFRWLRRTALFLLVLFLAGLTFGGGYVTAIYFREQVAQTVGGLLGYDLEETGSVSVNQVQPILTESSEGTPVTAIAKTVGPSVVTITSTFQNNRNPFLFESGRSSVGTGSGIIYSVDRDRVLIITNHHVIDGAASVAVSFNTEQDIQAKVIGFDSRIDLAVLSVSLEDLKSADASLADGITVAAFGDSDKVEVGELAVAIGNPMGKQFSNTITTGVVSAKNRQVFVDNDAVDFIQTDAAINPGNSGGALVNRYGEVIGINTAKYVDATVEGMGFAIPSNTALPVVEKIIETGGGQDTAYVLNADRPFLGVGISDINEGLYGETGMPFGVYVTSVYAGSAAETAGIQVGDVIYSLDNRRITSSERLFEALGSYKAGDKVTIGLVRSEEIMQVEATLTRYGDVVTD